MLRIFSLFFGCSPLGKSHSTAAVVLSSPFISASSSSCLPSAVRERKGKDIRASQRGDTWRYVAMHRYPRAQFPQQGLKPAKRESIPPPNTTRDAQTDSGLRVRGGDWSVLGRGRVGKSRDIILTTPGWCLLHWDVLSSLARQTSISSLDIILTTPGWCLKRQ